MNRRIGDARPSQIITTFGPGSIIDAKKDCVTITDLNLWPDKGLEIKDSRFASYIGVNYFKVPPTGNQFNSEDIPVIPFPDIHICSKCGNIFSLSENLKKDEYKASYLKFGPSCPIKGCGRSAYPSRFVRVCSNGHMDDFDYSAWVHKGKKCEGKLKMYSTGYLSSLGDIFVECQLCHQKRSLSGITNKENNDTQCHCSGYHPFRPTFAPVKCNSTMQVLQRGASNVYFPVIKSAISIPPYIDPLYTRIEDKKRELESFRTISTYLPKTPEEVFYDTFFKDDYSYEEFKNALNNIEKGVKDYISIKESEYNAIKNHNNPINKRSPLIFNAEEDPVPDILKPYFSHIIRINRLREIMCLKGFTRLDAPDPEAEQQINIVELQKKDWLPAIEVHGEGIFIEFDKNKINEWLNNTSVKKLDIIVKKAFTEYYLSRNWTVTNPRGALYMLMHTFSHLLIKEMGDKSGYSTASIKERIYCSDTMQGILIYTGSSDKEGSLGGLVELGKPNKILDIIKSAFEKALICTNDPECMYSALDKNLNISACHACCMIAETACENGNRLLNRNTIIPISDDSDLAYFKDLVKEICGLE